MKAEELHPNAQRVLQMAQAWNAGDVEKLMSFFDEHPTYHLAGQNAFSGTYHGRDEVERLAHRWRNMADSTRVEPLDILANDQYVVFVYRTYGQRGTKSLDVTVVNASEFGANGKVQRMWILADDQRSWDEFHG